MIEFLTSQLPLVESLQSALASSSALVSFWKAVTILGNEEFFLLLIPLVYWCISSRRGLQLGVLVIGGDAINVLFKLLFAAPRPYWFGEPIRALSTDASFGMPSSHAQNAVVVWLFLAYLASRKYGRIRPYSAAAILIALISLSRVVLGVHFPADIIGGWILGAVWLLLFAKFWHYGAAWFAQKKTIWRGAYAVFVVVAIFCAALIFIDNQALATIIGNASQQSNTFIPAYMQARNAGIAAVFARGGALFGLLIGVALMLRGARFDLAGTRAQKILRFVVGFVGVLVIWRGLAMVFPRGEDMTALVFRFLRYALLSLWVVYFAPLLFNRLKLGTSSEPRAI